MVKDTVGSFPVPRLQQLCNDANVLRRIFVKVAISYEEMLYTVDSLTEKVACHVVDCSASTNPLDAVGCY
jgi:hypothetical protein